MHLTERLNKIILYLIKNSNFYKDRIDRDLILNSVSDLKKFPFTSKDDITVFNDDFLCVEEKKVRDFVTTSGTLGNPTSFYLTSNDLNRLAKNEMHSLKISGVNQSDKVLLTTTIDKCFMAGLAYFLGCQELNVGVIRTGPGNIKYQWDMIERFQPTVIIIVPSFLLKMIQYAKENNIDISRLSLKKAICIGEPIRDDSFNLNSLGKAIKTSLDIKLHSTYASTEMMTAFTECEEGKGGHLQEDLLHVEVLDESDNEVESGKSGEVVITTLGVEAMPLLRFKTGDICTVHREICECGRSSLRLGPVLGRKNQRLKIKGTTIFPSAIIEAVYAFKEIKEFVIEVTLDKYDSDKLCLFVTNSFLESSSLKQFKDFLKSKLLFTPEVLIEHVDWINKKINSNNRKENRFIDNR